MVKLCVAHKSGRDVRSSRARPGAHRHVRHEVDGDDLRGRPLLDRRARLSRAMQPCAALPFSEPPAALRARSTA